MALNFEIRIIAVDFISSVIYYTKNLALFSSFVHLSCGLVRLSPPFIEHVQPNGFACCFLWYQFDFFQSFK